MCSTGKCLDEHLLFFFIMAHDGSAAPEGKRTITAVFSRSSRRGKSQNWLQHLEAGKTIMGLFAIDLAGYVLVRVRVYFDESGQTGLTIVLINGMSTKSQNTNHTKNSYLRKIL